ncbi:MAG: adenylyltransferase/cytidyltransferase family protein [Pirellulaceae bacterium]|nr:adenylyltransferase/cytidyltransferase family protein [Pirellulaceae bacterium]
MLTVIVGRFQPLHLGHQAMIECALADADVVLIILGSAFQPPSPRNPFNWQQRSEMICHSIRRPGRDRLCIAPLCDYNNSERWARALAASVRRAARNLLPENCGKVRLQHTFENAELTSHPEFAKWDIQPVERHGDYSGQRIRDLLFSAFFSRSAAGVARMDSAMRDIADQLPQPVALWLESWLESSIYPVLAGQWQALHEPH